LLKTVWSRGEEYFTGMRTSRQLSLIPMFRENEPSP
jgi:hypothetical protein